MKSIRFSLVCYFLVLLTAALGAVCWLAYHLAAAALDARREQSARLVEAQYQADCEKLRAALDRRLKDQAKIVATLARPAIHMEALFPFGAVGSPFTAAPHLHTLVWGLEGLPGRRKGEKELSLAEHLFWTRASQVDIEQANAIIPQLGISSDSSAVPLEMDGDPPRASVSSSPEGPAQEYFEVFMANGHSSGRSHSLGTDTLKLDMKLLQERYPQDFPATMELKPGVRVRCLTLRSRMTFRSEKGGPQASFPTMLWGTWRPPAGKGATKGMPVGPPPEWFGRDLFIVYAIDMGPTDARLQENAQTRNQNLADIDADTQSQLQRLRSRFLWIALATFAATLVGGYLLLLLGLAPLARLSEAVSKVTERDFRLKVDPAALPDELKPIAERLSGTLRQLGRAFEREKHAAADISHDLRTPLAALMTTVEVALRKSRSVKEYQEILEECHASGQQMSHLVERLLTLARLDAGADRARPRAVDAAQLATQCADLILPLAKERGLTLTSHVTPSLPLATDPDKLREVLTNLLHNAVEYNRPGGSIELTVERANGDLCVEVRDTGIGIPPEAREHIFERFYRADPSRSADTPHAGLGLAIVKSYVELLGGTIAVDSVLAQGTTFRVRVPVQELAPEQITVLA